VPVVTAPSGDHFALLHPEYDDHPVDAMVDRIPAISDRARRLRALARKVQARCNDDDLFIRYEDLRLNQQTDREQLYYDSGWEHGSLAGRAEEQDARLSPATLAFRDKLQVLLTTSYLRDDLAAAAMLSYARALVMGLHHPRSRADTSTRNAHRKPR
jgi:hypothetical protein